MTIKDLDLVDLSAPVATGKLHTCDGCGKIEQWGPAWQWYGSIRDLDDGCVLKLCSLACHPTAPERALARKRAGQ